jgi:hypothetical protein
VRVSAESWKQVWCETKVRISFRTVLLGQFGQEQSMTHDLIQIGVEFQAAHVSAPFYPFEVDSVQSE